MKDHELPTIDRMVAELDGSYMGSSLYDIVEGMDWGRHGERVGSTEGDRVVLYSPRYHNLRGMFSVLYYHNYPKKCIPTRSELEVEIYSLGSVSLLIKSVFERSHDGVVVRLYHRDEQSSFPIFGPTRLYGAYAQELERWYREGLPGSLPSPMNEACDMILLTHFALASTISWRSEKLTAVPHTAYLLQKLEKMVRATHEYDQKVSIPPHAA